MIGGEGFGFCESVIADSVLHAPPSPYQAESSGRSR